MRLHLRIDQANRAHVHLTVFINGQNCGKLVLGASQADDLIPAIRRGLLDHHHIFELTDEDGQRHTHAPIGVMP